MEEKNLKSEQYYNDLYDRLTVEKFRTKEKVVDKLDWPDCKNEEERLLRKQIARMCHEVSMYFEKGEEYMAKSETIQRWMDKDRKSDELLEGANPPKNIHCLKCGSEMGLELKTLHSDYPNDNERVLFMFRCPSGCKRGRAFFNNGEEWQFKPKRCDKCKSALQEESERKDNIITTYYNCPQCGHNETEELALTNKKEEEDNNFEADRARFCLSETEGQEYNSDKIRREGMHEMMKKSKEREEKKELYEKAAKISRLTIANLERLLTPALEKEGYVKFELSTPENGNNFVVPFNARDEKSDRHEWDSKNQLRKLINKTLENTNWRLMSDGTCYRLGFLTGRLRAYEKEEDLVKLLSKKDKISNK